MKKTAFLIVLLSLLCSAVFANDDDLFFFDDGVDIQTDVSAKDNLSKGILFEDGSVKIGGSLETSISTSTIIYDTSKTAFSDKIANSTLSPNLNSTLFIDARPTQTLRIYTKFAFNYPFKTLLGNSDTLKIKELFTDFSIADTAFFRFGIHVVKWGTGYFFSPVSDLINTSSINPENVDAQIDGCLNLRTQIIFPNSQNCLWLYLVPDTKSVSIIDQTATSLKYTSLAAKYELVIGTWEFGIGGIYKYQNSPKAMFTTSGNIGNVDIFSEFLYQYGSKLEWDNSKNWSGKSNILKFTIGCSYYWKDPSITLAAQYYYDGTNFSLSSITSPEMLSYASEYLTKGHNFAILANFGRIFGSTDFTATIFALANFGKDDITESEKLLVKASNLDDLLKTITISGMFYYSPIKELKLGIGPYINFGNKFSDPCVSLKLSATLGGGKY